MTNIVRINACSFQMLLPVVNALCGASQFRDEVCFCCDASLLLEIGRSGKDDHRLSRWRLMSWRAVAAGILASFLFAAGVLTGTTILSSSQASIKHSQAFKTSIRLHKASCRVMHDHGTLLRAQGLSRQGGFPTKWHCWPHLHSTHLHSTHLQCHFLLQHVAQEPLEVVSAGALKTSSAPSSAQAQPIPEAAWQQRCNGTIGTWCTAALSQEAVPWKVHMLQRQANHTASAHAAQQARQPQQLSTAYN